MNCKLCKSEMVLRTIGSLVERFDSIKIPEKDWWNYKNKMHLTLAKTKQGTISQVIWGCEKCSYCIGENHDTI